jgi:hypothetical protein
MRPLFFALAILCVAEMAAPQSPMFNQRDDKYRLLGLKRAKETYEMAKKEFERQVMLHEKQLISELELDRARAQVADAEVNYQQSLLAVLFETQYVTVLRAIKYQARDGMKHVRLTLANASGGTEEFQKLVNMEDKLFRSLQPDVVSYVYAGLLNNDNTIISKPYEAKIERLRHGEPQEIDFLLLQDLDAVTVNLAYGNGTTRSMKIFLQKDAKENKVLVQSDQFSQEAELGKTATFDLRLEQFSLSSLPFSLEVVNLPGQINRYFKDPSNDARLTQIRFNENTNTRKAALVVSLPDRPTDEVKMGASIQFYVLVIPSDGNGKTVAQTAWTPGDIEKLAVGYVKLELVPRGKGRLLVRAQQLYSAIKADGKVEMNLELVNEGTEKLDNIEVKIDPPMNWTKKIDPAIIPSLGVGEEKRVTFECSPPPGTTVGRYEIRIRTSALSATQPVNAEDKTVTVEIQAEANVLGTIVIVMLILGLVGGIVMFGIRLSKR